MEEKDFLITFMKFIDELIEIDEIKDNDDWDFMYERIKNINLFTSDIIEIVENFQSKGISFYEYLDKY